MTIAQVFQRPSIFIAAAVTAACGVALVATLAVVVTVLSVTQNLQLVQPGGQTTAVVGTTSTANLTTTP
ncbi:hypothetical protein MUN76_04210 [Leucobacter rhizosphaerae]|uniref:Uncharacterized protein n=1 Tax=Leucobacter rhizosphaerae TaxID=2932245 RepID=A0ABY4FY02_9MICO|nr:hypothetical protein [Leucobacter rhizosphaerae]UOQ61181.1 hypothetical protein MUN76_04210 [Leucobacter rhizosphaerae]